MATTHCCQIHLLPLCFCHQCVAMQTSPDQTVKRRQGEKEAPPGGFRGRQEASGLFQHGAVLNPRLLTATLSHHGFTIFKQLKLIIDLYK